MYYNQEPNDNPMEYDTVSFRIDRDKKAQLDILAKSMDRDRSYILNQAVDDFIALHQHQIAQINEGIAAADAGDFATDHEMAEAAAKWRR